MPPKQLYRLRHNPKIVVEKIGEGFMRLSATMKFRSVSYRDAKGHVDARRAEEFAAMFELIA